MTETSEVEQDWTLVVQDPFLQSISVYRIMACPQSRAESISRGIISAHHKQFAEDDCPRWNLSPGMLFVEENGIW